MSWKAARSVSRWMAWTSRGSAVTGGTRDMILPGNKKFIEGDILQRPNGGGGKGNGPGEGDSEDAFRFVLNRDEFVDLFLDDLELPDLAKRKLAEVESEGIRRAGYATSGSPANISRRAAP